MAILNKQEFEKRHNDFLSALNDINDTLNHYANETNNSRIREHIFIIKRGTLKVDHAEGTYNHSINQGLMFPYGKTCFEKLTSVMYEGDEY